MTVSVKTAEEIGAVATAIRAGELVSLTLMRDSNSFFTNKKRPPHPEVAMAVIATLTGS